jgi:hypothetical protein
MMLQCVSVTSVINEQVQDNEVFLRANRLTTDRYGGGVYLDHPQTTLRVDEA